MIKRYKNSIAFRLFFIVLVLSVALTIAITLLDTYTGYKSITTSAEEEIEEIQRSYSVSISASLWVMDNHDIRVHLEGILNHPNIEYLKIQNGNRIIASAGAVKSKHVIHREYPLYYTYNNKQIYLGTFSITAGLDKVYKSLFNNSLRRLFNDGILVFSIALFILFIVYITITRHLSDVAQYVAKLNPLDARRPLVIHRRLLHKTQDELDNVVTAINTMYKDLHNSFLEINREITERKLAEEKLQRYSAELEKSNRAFQEALANVKQLSGLLPICASCKKIRDDKGYWSGVEAYVSEHTEAVFTHGICPECEKKMYAELENLKNRNI